MLVAFFEYVLKVLHSGGTTPSTFPSTRWHTAAAMCWADARLIEGWESEWRIATTTSRDNT